MKQIELFDPLDFALDQKRKEEDRLSKAAEKEKGREEERAAKEAEKLKQREVKEVAKTGFGGKKALATAASIMHVSAGGGLFVRPCWVSALTPLSRDPPILTEATSTACLPARNSWASLRTRPRAACPPQAPGMPLR